MQEGLRKAVCEHDLKKRRYKGVKKAVSKGFYEIEREKKKAEEQDRKAVYEENLRKRRFRASKKAASEENLRIRRLKNKTEKLFMMKRIRGREGVELQRKLHLKKIYGEEG